MKRTISLLLALLLLLGLSACGKSEAVKNVEAMIKALPEQITQADIPAVQAAAEAYDALLPEEQEKVKNDDTLTAALNRSYELQLMGQWSNTYIDFWNVEGMYDRMDIDLREDMTFELQHSEFTSGTWSVSGQVLELLFDEYHHMLFDISKDGDAIMLTNGDNHYLLSTVFHARLDDMFRIAELTDENINDYCELYLQTVALKDAFGEATDYSKTYAMIGSRAYRDGWCCFNGKDIAIEVLFPAQNITHTFAGGDDGHLTEDAHAATMQFDIPFAEILEEVGSVSSRGTSTSDLTAESLTFGRAKGTLYFINLEYIAETPYVDQNNRGITLTDGSALPYCAWNEDLWNEDHPY